MTRSRLTVAAVSAAALGLAAVLVPTASIAEPITETPPASAQVIWADGADDFSTVDGDGETFSFPKDAWSWTAPVIDDAALTDYATFDANGIASNGTSAFAVIRGLSKPVSGTDLPAVLAEASLNAGPDVTFAVFLGSADGTSADVVVPAVGGLNGTDTQWGAGNETMDTAEFAGTLGESNLVIVGYLLSFAGNIPSPSPSPTVTEDPEEEVGIPLLQLLSAPSQGISARAAEPGVNGAASLRFGDLTTYFTPQPAAALMLARASYTPVQASTTGIPVTGSGFAPGETVTVGLSTGQSGSDVPGVTFVADADGNVAGVVVLPAEFATPGEYSLVLVGSSSGQFAASALVITAGAAPVAVPVPGEATYTG